MWALKNTTPYAAERNWTRDKDGNHVWIVAMKATFDILGNGSLRLADEQPPPALAPEFHGDPAKTSLKLESDLLEVKPGTDVLLNAQAYAPGGKPAKSVDVLLRMDNVSKHLVVHGERLYFKGPLGNLTTTPAQPFTKCPILYEYAFGGSDLVDPDPGRQKMDMRNPVGRGVGADATSLVHRPAHRIEYASGDVDRPAGFGPIASWWLPRSEFVGTYDADWEANKQPLLPDDYDPQHALASPVDQRSQRWLRGGELVELLNMTEHGGLRFSLPRLYFAYTTRFGRRLEEHRGHLATAIIEPDFPRVSAVYQTSLAVKRKDSAYLDDTTIRVKEYVR